MAQQPISELFINNVNVLPLWVKQVLYLKTKDKLHTELADFLDILVSDNLMQFYAPRLTFGGRSELNSHEKMLPEEFYTFLRECSKEHTLFETTIANYWTFEQTCLFFIRGIDMQYIDIPKDEMLVSVAQFIAGKIRTGELLKRMGKIDIIQLEKTLRIQKEREEEGRPIKIAELMIELKYITKEDIDILLSFKEDAKKRFVMGVGFSFIKNTGLEDAQELMKNMQKEIKRLDEENRILKNRLRKILNLKN